MIYNFTAFVVFFLIARILLAYLWPVNQIFLAVSSAIIANFIAPKFGAIKTDEGLKIKMKWVFIKGMHDL
jgi:hypothetical protein